MRLLTQYKKDIEALFAKRYLTQGVSIERLRFFARKTVKYGHLVKVKLGRHFLPAYYCWFYSGFGVYVIFWDLPQVAWDEGKIFAVIVENPERETLKEREPPEIIFAVDWFYPS
jgi:hypothetical protein